MVITNISSGTVRSYFLAVNLHVFSVSGALSSPGPVLVIAQQNINILFLTVPVPVPTSQ